MTYKVQIFAYYLKIKTKAMIKTALKHALRNSDLSLKYGSEMTGLSKTELSEYRNGKRSISIEKALTVALGFGVHEDFIKYLNSALVDKCRSQNL